MTENQRNSEVGYSAAFFPTSVPFPRFNSSRQVRELTYPHFTILQDPIRRLPAATGVKISGPELVEIDRVDDWHFDSRIPRSEQTGDDVYSHNDLDRGHQVRRRDPVWGSQARAANVATFVFTNAAPQAAEFNQGKELWVGLEDHVLTYAKATEQKISVFTGPVLDPNDPNYRGIQIPLLYWKVVAWGTRSSDGGGAELRSAAFVLDQSSFLAGAEMREAIRAAEAVDDPPPLGPFRTFQVPVADVAKLTGLKIAQLAAADVLPASQAMADLWEQRAWQHIAGVNDIVL